MQRLILLVFLLTFSSVLLAQTQQDSLLARWNDTALADTIRLKAMQSLAWGMVYKNPDSTILLTTSVLDFAKNAKNRKWEGKALNALGGAQHVKGNYSAALNYYQQALSIFQTIQDLKSLSALYNNIGLIYTEKGNYLKALEYHEKDRQVGEALKDNEILSSCYNNLGTVYSNIGNHKQALEYYQKGLELAESVKDQYGIAIGYNNIGSVYYNQELYADALHYYHKSVEYRQKLGDLHGTAILYNNIGLIYRDQKSYARAMEYFQDAIEIEVKLNNQVGLSSSYHNMGSAYNEQKEYSKAANWCNKAYEAVAQSGALRPTRNACHCLYEAYKGMGQNGKALQYHEQYVALNDSLKKAETSERLEQLEFEKAILADSLSREEEKLQMKNAYQSDLEKKRRSGNIVLGVALAILLLALVFMSRMLYFQKQSEGLQSKTQHLEKQQLINEIDLLKTQVNPHFLFNSLSILSSLVHTNADLSEQFIDQLSRSYRYILDQKDQTLVTLRTELEFIRSYAFLLKIRFENKFELRIQIDEAALDQYKIAPLTLQLLVENAVKHNRMSVQMPLIVDVSIDQGFMIVKNQLQMRPQRESSTGTGLNNIINRYALLTERTVKAGECDDAFVVKVPLL